jgi:hypothetical protein
MLYMDVPVVVVEAVLNLYGLTVWKICHPINTQTSVFIPFLGGYTTVQINHLNPSSFSMYHQD